MRINIAERFNFKKKDNKKQIPVENLNFHKISYQELTSQLGTSLQSGLTETDANVRLQKNGKNIIVQKGQSVILKILGYLFTGFCGVLWVASLVCFLAWKPLGEPPDPTNMGLAILLLVVIGLQALFSAFQDWSSGRVMKSISNMMPNSAVVIRDGKEKNIMASELVVGDLVLLAFGSKVPADVRIIESNDLKFDRSMLTGESEHIEGSAECTDEKYHESKNIAFMTTLITNGNGKGIIILTGKDTMMGKIASLSSNTKTQTTSLQREINRFVLIICSLAITTIAIILIVWGVWLRRSYPTYIDTSTIMVNCIGIAVGFIPTGLPVAVTLSLLLMARKMAKNRVLVKNLTTIETLSCVNVIASDKTGTLTQNKMFVASASAGVTAIELKETNQLTQTVGYRQLVALSSLCNNARFEDDVSKPETEKVPINQRKAKGDATDIALLRFSAERIEEENFASKYSDIFQIPFNSRNKWLLKVIRPVDISHHEKLFPEEKMKNLFLMKGAPDILLRKCKTLIDIDGYTVPLDEHKKMEIIRLQNDWCMQGQRVILLCKRICSDQETEVISMASQADVELLVNAINDFCIVGLLGIIDPPREGMSDVIARCRGAGIKVFMVTGDYALTAAAIASQIGIFTNLSYDTVHAMREKFKNLELELQTQPDEEAPTKSRKKSSLGATAAAVAAAAQKRDSKFHAFSSLLLTGSEIETLVDHDWRIITKYDEIVLARTTPEQKLVAVRELRKDGYIVAVTGDGVNDSPALKNADIGIAMGGGSEVAMDAAQLVLLDNNFTSIILAIQNGRMVFDNLRKVILYLLPAGSFAEMTPILTNIFLGLPLPLSAFLMICICVLTDMAPALGMMIEKPEMDVMKRPPRTKNTHLVDFKLMFHAYAFLGIIEALAAHFLYFLYLYWYGGFLPGDIFLAFSNWQDGYKGYSIDQLNNFNYTAQTIFFICLVLMQCFGNIYATRTNYHSFFSKPPFARESRNLWLFAAQFTAVALMILIVFLPFVNSIFNTSPPPVQFFFIPLAFAVFMFFADELRKLLVRKKVLCFPKLAW